MENLLSNYIRQFEKSLQGDATTCWLGDFGMECALFSKQTNTSAHWEDSAGEHVQCGGRAPWLLETP